MTEEQPTLTQRVLLTMAASWRTRHKAILRELYVFSENEKFVKEVGDLLHGIDQAKQ